jgi:hypothetical protein
MPRSDLKEAFDDLDQELTPMEEDCPCGSHDPFERCCYLAAHIEEVEEELLHLFRRHPVTSHISELETIQLVEAASELIWPMTRQPMHGDPEPEGDEVTRAELYAVADRFRGESVETGYCMCGSPVDVHTWGDGHSPVDEGLYRAEQQRLAEEIDLEALIG